MSRKIFFGNYKGGVGKTTSTYNIAMNIAKNSRYKILLIDLDPQSSLTTICMNANNEQLDKLEKNQTLNYIYSVYGNLHSLETTETKDDSKVIKKLKNSSQIDFIPNSFASELGGLDNIMMKMGNSVQNLIIMRDFINNNNLQDKYDFIFFDCPPSNNIITQSAFLCSDYYVVPAIMDELSVRGVEHYVSTVKKIYNNYCVEGERAEVLSALFGEEPKLIGVFETMRKGRTITSIHREKVEAQVGYLFKTEVKHSKEISDSIGQGEKSSNVEYYNLSKELLERISEMETV